MRYHKSSFIHHQSTLGAAMAEYLPPLFLGCIMIMILFKTYGEQVGDHVGRMAQQMAQNYYQGWFYPEDEPGQAQGSAVKGSGGPLDGSDGDNEEDSEGEGSNGSEAGNASDVFSGLPTTADGNNLFPGGGSVNDNQCAAGSSTGGNVSAAPLHTGFGNPIDVGTGNKFQQEVDYVHSGETPLHFKRFYNSRQSAWVQGLGYGWRHSYQRQLVELADNGSILQTETQLTQSDSISAIRDDGAVYVFQRQGEHWQANGVVDTLVRQDNGWLYTQVNHSREWYSLSGQLQRIEYPNGVSHQLHYEQGQLVRISDSRGPEMQLQYQQQWLSQVHLPNQEFLRFQYSENGNLQAYHRINNGVWSQLKAMWEKHTAEYHYEAAHYPHGLTGLTDAEGRRFATWGYDVLGRANLSQHGDGVEKHTFDYRADGTVRMTNAAGLVTTLYLEPARQGYRRLTRVDGKATPTCPDAQQHYQYNDEGFLALSIDAEGHATRFTRNERGLVTVLEQGLGRGLMQSDQANLASQNQWQPEEGARRTEQVWHTTRPIITEAIYSTFLDGLWQSYLKQAFRYTLAWRLQNRTDTDLSQQAHPYSTYGQQRQWNYEYEFHDAARTTLSKVSVNGPRAPLSDGSDDITVVQFDHSGRLSSLVNALGHRTEITAYHRNGQPNEIRFADGSGMTLVYDRYDRLDTATRHGQDVNGLLSETTDVDLDRTGVLQKITMPDGRWQRFIYNEARQLTQLENNHGEIIQLETSDVSGVWTAQWVYGSSGNLERQYNRQLDSLGRVFKLLGQQGQSTALGYTKNGRLATINESGNNNPTQHQYDNLGRLSQTVDALLGTTHISYGKQGRIAKIIDAEGSTTEYRYNGFGDVIWQRSDAAGESMLSLDAAGNPISMSKNNSGTVQFNYDVLNRLTLVDYPGKKQDIQYRYDQSDIQHGQGKGRLTQVQDSNGTLDYQYNALGRITAEEKTDLNKKVQALFFSYNQMGQRKIMQYPNGDRLQYHYDDNRLNRIDYHDKRGKVTTLIDDIQYAAFGAAKAWENGNGSRYQRQIDLDGRVSGITVTDKANNAIWKQQYQYDQKNDIQSINQQQESHQLLLKYKYDAVHRLLSEKTDANTARQQYRYDRAGNRIQSTKENKNTNYRYEAGNRLLSYNNKTIERHANGNSLKITDGKDTSHFIYGSQNQPLAYFKNNTLQATYRYNAFRQRISKRLEKTQYHYFYNRNGQLLLEKIEEVIQKETLDPKETSQQEDAYIQYVWLDKMPVAMITHKNDEVKFVYLHGNHLNTPRMATDQTQTAIWQWQSDAFGIGKADEDPDKNGKKTTINLRFPGQYYDQESGLHYNFHRYYDPQLGRYTQSDPIGLMGGINTFGYVGGNPLQRVDPLGLYDELVHYYTTYFLAVTAGLPADQAKTMALAAQYIDNNKDTEPLDAQGVILNGSWGAYHFTLEYDNGFDGDNEDNTGILTRFQNPGSKQLNNLYNASQKTPFCGADKNTKLQFYGEYLHAFEDTFAHRNPVNKPLAILNNEGVFGHALYFERPDKTYNQVYIKGRCQSTSGLTLSASSKESCETLGALDRGTTWTEVTEQSWQYNELRTLQMEKEVFEKIRKDFGVNSNISWNDLAADGSSRIGLPGDEVGENTSGHEMVGFQSAEGETGILQKFNAFNDETDTYIPKYSNKDYGAVAGEAMTGNEAKIMILNDWLKDHGLETIHLYKEKTGKINRVKNFKEVDKSDFPGVIFD